MPRHQGLMQVRNSAYAILEIHTAIALPRTYTRTADETRWSNLARACLCPDHLLLCIGICNIWATDQWLPSKVKDTLREQKALFTLKRWLYSRFYRRLYSHGFLIWLALIWFVLMASHYNNRRATVCRSSLRSVCIECAQCADKYERLFWLGTESMCYLQNHPPHKWALQWCSAEILSHSSPWSFLPISLTLNAHRESRVILSSGMWLLGILRQ